MFIPRLRNMYICILSSSITRISTLVIAVITILITTYNYDAFLYMCPAYFSLQTSSAVLAAVETRGSVFLWTPDLQGLRSLLLKGQLPKVTTSVYTRALVRGNLDHQGLLPSAT